jgi:putative phage-type endonuclease
MKKSWIVRIEDRTPEWHEHRKNGLGASSAAIVCGLSPYKPTKMQLFYEKVGTMEPDRTMSAPAFHGIHQEDYVANIWKYYDGTEDGYMENFENNKIIRQAQNLVGFVQNPKYPHLYCNLDRVIKKGSRKLNDDGTLSDEITTTLCPLEIKTMNSFVYKKYDGVPDMYIVQVHQQMMIMECDYAEIAILIDGRGFKVFPIERNEDIVDMITERTYDFWSRVLQGRQALIQAEMAKEDDDFEKYHDYIGVIQQLEPEPDDNENYSTFLSDTHTVEQEIMMGNDDLLGQVQHLQTVKEMIKQLEKEKRELENKVKNEFRKESVEKIEFPGHGYMRYYQRANNNTKMLDVRINKPDEFVIGVELENIDRKVGYII